MSSLLEKILNLIFPRVCGFCGKLDKNSLCARCKLKLNKILRCKTEKAEDKNFSYLVYLFDYDGIIREKLIGYKFNDMTYLNETFVNFVIKNEKICGFLKKYDIIIPVPIHSKRRKQRGYNQSELMARNIAKNTGLEIVADALVKVRNNTAQSTLNREDRQNNVRKVYGIKNFEKIKNKRVVLVDDIYTTGSTVNECSRVLKNAGASEVAVLVVAKD